MEICGSNTPPAFVSNGNALRVSIEVLSEVYFTFNEMEAHYSVLDNGTQIIIKIFMKNLSQIWYIF